jgi:RNA polymerase sigma-32 factor
MTRTKPRESVAAGFISERLQAHLDRVLAMPRLGRQEEVDLIARWRDLSDREAAGRVIETHMRYVVAIALGYRNYPVSMDDLIGEGSLGLMAALSRFDPSKGTRFVTYASFWIRAYVLDCIIRSWHSGKQGTGPFTSKIFFKLRRQRARLYGRFGDSEAGKDVLARSMGLTRQSLGGMLMLLDAGESSLDQPVRPDQDCCPGDGLGDPSEGPDAAVEREDRRRFLAAAMRGALAELDARERFVVERRLLEESGATLAEIGRRLGISRERARQLEVRAMKKLRVVLEPAWEELGS